MVSQPISITQIISIISNYSFIMIKFLQKTTLFYASRFQAAVKAMKESGKEPWAEKISKEEKSQLQDLYKQAMSENTKQTSSSKKRINNPNFDSPMTSFRSPIGKQTAQGSTEAQVFKSYFKQPSQKHENPAQNKTYFNKSPQNTVPAGKAQTQATQSLAKGATDTFNDTLKTESPTPAGRAQTEATQSLAKSSKVDIADKQPAQNEDLLKSSPESVSQEGYGNRTGFQANQQKDKSWDKNKSNRSKEDFENQYVNLARSILEKNKAEKYIKDF